MPAPMAVLHMISNDSECHSGQMCMSLCKLSAFWSGSVLAPSLLFCHGAVCGAAALGGMCWPPCYRLATLRSGALPLFLYTLPLCCLQGISCRGTVEIAVMTACQLRHVWPGPCAAAERQLGPAPVPEPAPVLHADEQLRKHDGEAVP